MVRAFAAVAAALVALTLSGSPAAAQSAPPGTEIYLVPVSRAAGRLTLGRPVNVTNRRGYDNQPAFTPGDSALLYTSIRADGQADIYRYDLASRTTTRLTATPESEYSPTAMPGGKRFSAVRVERDSTQRLWSFRMDGSAPALVFEHIAPVGYHAWVDADTAVLYVLGKPNTLEIADRRSGRTEAVAHDVGRSLQRVPGRGAVSFLQHESDSTWSLRLLDLEHSVGGMRVVVKLATMLPRSDYVAWLPNGTAVAGQDGKLFALEGGTWREVADFGGWGMKGISRLAVSGDGRWLAVVGNE